jgi:DNA-binding LacI/PurR family transcriptional regulator
LHTYAIFQRVIYLPILATMHNTATHNLRKSVTSHDVAELAGVSQSAVSRSFTPGASVAEATRLKVLQAAKRLGYLPNLHARTLITGRTRIVGVVLAHLDNLFYPRFLQLLSEQLQTQGMQVMLFIAEGQGNDDLLEHMLQYRVDAIVLAATSLSSSLGKACLQAGIPVVMFNRVSAQSSDRSFHSVRTDQEEGARQIALHLIAGGHERIAYVAGHLDASTNQERENGFRTTLAEQGKAVFAYGVGKYDAATAQAVVRSWYLDRAGQPRPLSLCPDAIFAADDQMALAIMDTLRDELGLRVPAQVSVAGFDDVPQASASAYGLTTYAQPLGPMVQELVELLMAQIAQRNEPTASNKKNKGHATVVPGQLIVRTSTRQPI